MGHINILRNTTSFDELNELFAPTWEVLMLVAVFTAHVGNADGMQPTTTDHQPTETDHRSTGNTVPTPTVRSYQVTTTDRDPNECT
jgi:hypothetical protein